MIERLAARLGGSDEDLEVLADLLLADKIVERLRPEREFELPENFWPVTKLRYRMAQQKGPAPLVFIIWLGVFLFEPAPVEAGWFRGLQVLAILLGGVFSMGIGVLFGIPSLRIKGLYLAVATLAAQFFSDWMFLRIKWFTNDSASGSVSVSGLEFLGLSIDSPTEKYLLCLSVLVVLALLAKNLVRSAIGPVERLLNMLGHQSICATAYAVSFLMNVGLCIALVPRYGGMGAAASTSLSLTFETILLFVVVRSRLGLHVLAFGKARPTP